MICIWKIEITGATIFFKSVHVLNGFTSVCWCMRVQALYDLNMCALNNWNIELLLLYLTRFYFVYFFVFCFVALHMNLWDELLYANRKERKKQTEFLCEVSAYTDAQAFELWTTGFAAQCKFTQMSIRFQILRRIKIVMSMYESIIFDKQ